MQNATVLKQLRGAVKTGAWPIVTISEFRRRRALLSLSKRIMPKSSARRVLSDLHAIQVARKRELE